MAPSPRLRFFSEILGLTFDQRCWNQINLAVRGDQYIPKSRGGLSSLELLSPRLAFPLWRGKPFLPRKVILTNLFNHTQTPIKSGWSVHKTQVHDFRGARLTYDSHNGTDLAIPVGTQVVSAAKGRVVWMCDELNRGGKKIGIDHGHGLMTTYAHLARSLVSVGQYVAQGESIAWSGYSGLDAVISFPFGIPHVHMNVWCNGLPVDPFAVNGEVPLWNHALPVPENKEYSFRDSEYSEEQVRAGTDACLDSVVRSSIEGKENLWEKAAELLFQQNYYPTRFSEHISPYKDTFERNQRLRLPFRKEDFDGVVFRDEVSL